MGGITGDNLFLIIEVEGITNDQGREIVEAIKADLLEARINSLYGFESYLSDEIKKTNLPTTFSLAAGFLNDNIFYLRTIGNGEIFLSRGHELAKIIKGDNSASGYIEKNDLLIFTTSRFNEIIGSEYEINKIVSGKETQEISPKLDAVLSNQSLVALFVKLKEGRSTIKQNEVFVPERVKTTVEAKINPIGQLLTGVKRVYQDLRRQSDQSAKKKVYTAFAVIAIFLILVWSVFTGYKRRDESRAQKKVDYAKEVITEKLTEAEEIAFLNLSRSLVLIAEAKQELVKLKQEIGDKKKEEVKELEFLIKVKESAIIKKEEKGYEEFYDLALDDSEAKGVRMSLDEDKATILTAKKNTAYVLSLTKKSLDKRSLAETGMSSLTVSYDEDTFFFVPNKGIYRVDEEGGVKKMIEQDDEWGNIIDMQVYNGNLYLLDTEAGDIYKYLPTEGGFSDKRSYFGPGENISLKNANSLAIDASVYIGFKDKVRKFTAGVSDDFSTTYPGGDINITKVFTAKDLGGVYVWDKEKGSVFVLSKEGTYEKEINSSILNKASDIVVYKNDIYALVGSKIYKISLD